MAHKEGMEEIQEEHQQAIVEKDSTIALLNDDLKNREYESYDGLQGEIRAKDQQIAALLKRYIGYFSDDDKKNGISIIAKKQWSSRVSIYIYMWTAWL